MRFAIRSLLKAPGFSAAVVLTLAIGLGANAALFAVVNRLVARNVDVLVLAIRDSLRWAAAGLAGGGVLAFFAARALAGALYEVPPTDLVTFAGAGAAATMVVLFGSTLAARTAMNVDPLVAIRDQ
jgi:hypothetical protein